MFVWEDIQCISIVTVIHTCKHTYTKVRTNEGQYDKKQIKKQLKDDQENRLFQSYQHDELPRIIIRGSTPEAYLVFVLDPDTSI